MLINAEDEIVKKAEREVVRAYLDILGRVPDDKGRTDYVNALVSGCTTVHQITSNLLDSQEYKLKKSLIAAGKIGKDVAHIDHQTGRIVWNISEGDKGGEEINKFVSKDIEADDIVFVSTWNIKCGIATYTGYLSEAINKIYKSESKSESSNGGGGGVGGVSRVGSKGVARGRANGGCVGIFSINSGVGYDRINGKLVHLQHEFGIMKKIPESSSKVIVTFHSVTEDTGKIVGMMEGKLNVVGYVAHCEEIGKALGGYTKRDIHVIPHGTRRIPGAGNGWSKRWSRELLGFDRLGIDGLEDCAFVFGFQSGNKNFDRIISGCRNAGIKVIVGGSVHQCGYKSGIEDKDVVKEDIDSGQVVFLGRFLNDAEIDLFALGSDMLIFDYVAQNHYSCSGAMHRVIGAGKPCIVSDTKHFTDVTGDGSDGVLKFNSLKDLELKIREGLERRDELGKNALEYAKRTSWEIVAQLRLDMYRKYVDI